MKKYGVILLYLLTVSCVTLQPAVDKKSPVSQDQQAKDEVQRKKETEAAGLLEKAKSLYSEHRTADAAEALQQLLARHPEAPSAAEALYLTALYRLELKQIDLALQNGFKLIEKYPDSEFWVRGKKVLGDCYTENKDYVKAGQQYLDGMNKAKTPEDRESLRLPLLALINEKLPSGELRILYKTYSNSETAPAMGLRLCKLELEAKNIPEAKKLLADLSQKISRHRRGRNRQPALITAVRRECDHPSSPGGKEDRSAGAPDRQVRGIRAGGAERGGTGL